MDQREMRAAYGIPPFEQGPFVLERIESKGVLGAAVGAVGALLSETSTGPAPRAAGDDATNDAELIAAWRASVAERAGGATAPAYRDPETAAQSALRRLREGGIRGAVYNDCGPTPRARDRAVVALAHAGLLLNLGESLEEILAACGNDVVEARTAIAGCLTEMNASYPPARGFVFRDVLGLDEAVNDPDAGPETRLVSNVTHHVRRLLGEARALVADPRHVPGLYAVASVLRQRGYLSGREVTLLVQNAESVTTPGMCVPPALALLRSDRVLYTSFCEAAHAVASIALGLRILEAVVDIEQC